MAAARMRACPASGAAEMVDVCVKKDLAVRVHVVALKDGGESVVTPTRTLAGVSTVL